MRVPKSNNTIEGTIDATHWLEEHPNVPSQLRRILSRYYQVCGRDYPWRRANDPYQILLAEMLLQKTAVKPVEGIWTAFLEQYPNIETLASASLVDIQAIVRPLGLQKRARLLSEVARTIVQETGGKFIGSAEFLTKLPGVGNYTASAILSYAFNIPATTIDVNAGRVYSRICGFSPKTLRQSLAFAQVVSKRVATQETHREVNLGTLDLAAQICKPKPLCNKCPALALCQFAQSKTFHQQQ